MKRRALSAYWWNARPNFGDRLTPLLLEAAGYDVTWAPPEEARACLVGSVLEVLGQGFSGVIAGTGFIQEGAAHPFPNARILALRGPLSAKRAHVDAAAFGDPGLLCPWLIEQPARTSTRIGIVPHYMDASSPVIAALGSRVKLIDVSADPLSVLREIADCEAILSSSLHGIVTADAFGIPSAWLKLSDAVIGDGFKFRDYAAGVGGKITAHTITGEETEDALAALAVLRCYDLSAIQSDLRAALEVLA